MDLLLKGYLSVAEVREGRSSYGDFTIAISVLIATVTATYFFWNSYHLGRSRKRKEQDEKKEVEELLRRRINHDDDGMPFYEYLVRWKPTWERLDLLEEQEGSQDLFEKIGLVRSCQGEDDKYETLIQWSDSWEAEDDLCDATLLDAQRRFRGEDSDNLVDGPMDELPENNEKPRDEGGDNSDDEDETVEEKLYEFEGKIYRSYDEMIDAKREQNKRVLRRFVYGLLDKSSDRNGIFDDHEENDTDDEGVYEFEGKIYHSYLDMVEAKRERNRRIERRLMMHSFLDESFLRHGSDVAVA